MKQTIRKILKEEGDDKKERFIKSAKKLAFILETVVNSNLITDIEIDNISYSSKYNQISGDLLITSWCYDVDILEFTYQVKKVDEELDKVFLNYQFSSNGSFGKKKGKYNYLQSFPFACEWYTGGESFLKMKYHFIQDDYDDDEGVN